MTQSPFGVESLLQKVLVEEDPTQEELDFLKANRSLCLPIVHKALAEEIARIAKQEDPLDFSHKLYISLLFITLFEDEEAFDLVKPLFFFDHDLLEGILEEEFFAEIFPRLLVAIGKKQWRELKELLEHPNISSFIRIGCLDAFAHLYALGVIERQEIVSYLKSFLEQALEKDLDDSWFLNEVVRIYVNVWPEESLEEIKEAYALNLIDSDYIPIEEVLEQHQEGKEACLRTLCPSNIPDFFCIRYFPLKKEPPPLADTSLEKKVEAFQNWYQENISGPADQYVEKTDRNAPCPCFSGKKYKKCCLNKITANRPPHFIPSSFISKEPLKETFWGYADISHLSSEEKNHLTSLIKTIVEEPRRGLEQCQKYLAQYSDFPILYYALYLGYSTRENPREALKVLKELYRKFPDFLFGQIAYLDYLLRRGEIEKVTSLLSGAFTLPQFHPLRTVFYIGEWGEFCRVLGSYYIKLKKPDFAKMYLELLQNMKADKEQIDLLKNELRNAMIARPGKKEFPSYPFIE